MKWMASTLFLAALLFSGSLLETLVAQAVIAILSAVLWLRTREGAQASAE
jgi:hypothetical protein